MPTVCFRNQFKPYLSTANRTNRCCSAHTRSLPIQLCDATSPYSSLASHRKRILFNVYVTVHNCLNNRAPAYLSELIDLYFSGRCLRSAGQSQLVCHKSNTKFCDRAFVNYAPRLWKSLPITIHSILSKSTFKKNLKTYLFNVSDVRFYHQ